MRRPPLPREERAARRNATQEKGILRLNDDCILAILDHVEPNELPDLAIACQRIHTLASKRLKVYREEVQRFRIICDHNVCNENKHCAHRRMSMAEFLEEITTNPLAAQYVRCFQRVVSTDIHLDDSQPLYRRLPSIMLLKISCGSETLKEGLLHNVEDDKNLSVLGIITALDVLWNNLSLIGFNVIENLEKYLRILTRISQVDATSSRNRRRSLPPSVSKLHSRDPSTVPGALGLSSRPRLHLRSVTIALHDYQSLLYRYLGRRPPTDLTLALHSRYWGEKDIWVAVRDFVKSSITLEELVFFAAYESDIGEALIKHLNLVQLFRVSHTLKRISIRGQFDEQQVAQLMFTDTQNKLTNDDKFRLHMVKHSSNTPHRELIKEKIK